MGHPIYHLDLRIERCRLRARLNGVPIGELAATTDQPEWFAPPLNPYLVGVGNVLEVDVTPLSGTEPGDDWSAVKVEATVRRYEKGMPVAPDAGPIVRVLALMAVLTDRLQRASERNEKLAAPQTLSDKFDNEAVTFAAELAQAPALGDLEAVKDYGLRLRDLMRAGDVSGLAGELAGKVRAYATAFDEPEPRMAQSLAQVLKDSYLARGLQADFERADIELAPCAGGRLCELCRPNAAPFIESTPDEQGNTMQMPVVVGVHDGKLGVVR